jgi:hypothetical protein
MKREKKPCLLCRIEHASAQFSLDKRASSLAIFRGLVAKLEETLAKDAHYFDTAAVNCRHGRMKETEQFAEVTVRLAQAQTNQGLVASIRRIGG